MGAELNLTGIRINYISSSAFRSSSSISSWFEIWASWLIDRSWPHLLWPSDSSYCSAMTLRPTWLLIMSLIHLAYSSYVSTYLWSGATLTSSLSSKAPAWANFYCCSSSYASWRLRLLDAPLSELLLSINSSCYILLNSFLSLFLLSNLCTCYDLSL